MASNNRSQMIAQSVSKTPRESTAAPKEGVVKNDEALSQNPQVLGDFIRSRTNDDGSAFYATPEERDAAYYSTSLALAQETAKTREELFDLQNQYLDQMGADFTGQEYRGSDDTVYFLDDMMNGIGGFLEPAVDAAASGAAGLINEDWEDKVANGITSEMVGMAPDLALNAAITKIPGVGLVAGGLQGLGHSLDDFYGAATGKDYLTQEDLTAGERARKLGAGLLNTGLYAAGGAFTNAARGREFARGAEGVLDDIPVADLEKLVEGGTKEADDALAAAQQALKEAQGAEKTARTEYFAKPENKAEIEENLQVFAGLRNETLTADEIKALRDAKTPNDVNMATRKIVKNHGGTEADVQALHADTKATFGDALKNLTDATAEKQKGVQAAETAVGDAKTAVSDAQKRLSDADILKDVQDRAGVRGALSNLFGERAFGFGLGDDAAAAAARQSALESVPFASGGKAAQAESNLFDKATARMGYGGSAQRTAAAKKAWEQAVEAEKALGKNADEAAKKAASGNVEAAKKLYENFQKNVNTKSSRKAYRNAMQTLSGPGMMTRGVGTSAALSNLLLQTAADNNVDLATAASILTAEGFENPALLLTLAAGMGGTKARNAMVGGFDRTGRAAYAPYYAMRARNMGAASNAWQGGNVWYDDPEDIMQKAADYATQLFGENEEEGEE